MLAIFATYVSFDLIIIDYHVPICFCLFKRLNSILRMEGGWGGGGVETPPKISETTEGMTMKFILDVDAHK